MEPHGIIQEEATINPHEILSSSLSSSSSSSSPSSSPSHTQSFASSPSSLKDLSAPSSASGSSSSSSSPFSEPSSPQPSITTDHASTSSNTRAHQHSDDASVSVEEATNRVDDGASTSSTTGFYPYPNASVHVEEAHCHVDDAGDGDNNVDDDAGDSVDADDDDSLRSQLMSKIYSVVVEHEAGSSSRSLRGNSGSELHENDKMNGMPIGSDEAEMCNRPVMSNGSVECGFNVNSSACSGAANADSALDTHTDIVNTENALENHISMIDSESVPEKHVVVVNTCDSPVSEHGKVEEGQEIVHKTNNQEHGSLNVESPTKRAYIPIETADPNGETSMVEGVFEHEASADMESQYISDIYKMGHSAEMNGTYLQGDNLKTCDPSSCTSEVKKRVCLFSSQPEEFLEGGSNFLDSTLMHHSPEKSFTEVVDMDASDASAIQGPVDVHGPNSAILPEEPVIESLGQISPDNHGLKRAQTMPTGNFEVVDGVVRSRKKEDLKRSITDKYIGGKNITGQSPGLKISRRKQKKLVKRICKIQKDGTVIFDADKGAELAPGLFSPSTSEDSSQEEGDGDRASPLPLQIAMLIVGTRGDVQPFVAIGKRLQEYGHRVRLATHANFEEFVLQAGLEFYPLGGDPKVLAEYMVKNKGFLPSGPSEIRTQRKQLKSIINSLLPACTFPDKSNVPFKVQAIIANPPAYGHVHVAEYLNVPLHIFFTMPWTPTSEFPHPLSRSYHGPANRLSYQVVDSLIWLGIRGLINDFRKKKLKLRPITYLSGSQFSVSKLPTGYIWSPHLVPKPKDWGSKIDVVGFCFLDLLQDYQPPHDLVEWLKAGPPPIYVGFGSLPVEDAAGMTKIIVEALEKTYQRGIISRGWGGIGTSVKLPDTIYLLDNCPHDWLFSQCAAVVHHGGAGTTAAGLRAACPTTIVPFFGDQPFWGERVHAKGVGPPPIPVNEFSLDKLVHAINYMMNPKVKQNALDLTEAMKGEDGVGGAVAAFHKHLPPILPNATNSNASKMPSNSLYAHLSCCF